MKVKLPPKHEREPAALDTPIPLTPELRALIQKVGTLFRRPDVQLFLAVGRKLRAEAEDGARAKRRWETWSKSRRSALEGFRELDTWFKQLVPLRGRGDDGYAASDDETLKQMFSEIEGGHHASPHAALRAYIAAKKFAGGGMPDSIARRIKKRPLYKDMMRLRRQKG